MARYLGVVTTGVYCRPECSGRPRRDHVVDFRTPAAAEAAGFRACRRCRPYREAPPPPGVGPALLDQAVRMVLAGALDDGTESRLASRLGVSTRHLRRLFTAELGLTPDQLARSNRAHFAHRLVDDTDLPLLEVAFAAGYGSVRQFNRALRATFQAPPRELRAHRREDDRLVAGGGLTVRLPFAPPLEWEAMLRYLRRRAIPGVEAVDDDAYRRTIRVEGEVGAIELWRGGADHLLLRTHLPSWQRLAQVVRRARRIFNLDVDAAAANAVLERDPRLAPLVRVRPGARPLGAWDEFETAVRVVLGQQVTVAAASTLAGRLARRHGDEIAGTSPLSLDRLFPGPAQLAEADLGNLGLTAGRARAVRGLAEAVATGSICLGPGHTVEEQTEAIRSIPGLGPWTAQCLAIRLGHRDAFPPSDLGLRRALGAPGGPLAAAEVAGAAERWRPWRAHAAAHLWLGAAGSAAG